jgi:uncharacterized membrane protein YcaP (DUF421 family)
LCPPAYSLHARGVQHLYNILAKIVKKVEKRNIVTSDLNINPKYEGLSYDLVIDGKVLEENLIKVNKTYGWLKNEINKLGYKPEDALIVMINEAGEIYSQKKRGN